MGPTPQTVATARWWIIVGLRTFSIVCLFYSFHSIVGTAMMALDAFSRMAAATGTGNFSDYSEVIYLHIVDILIRLLACVLLWSFSPFIAARLARVPRPTCPGCGYSIAPQTVTCPECGLVLHPDRVEASSVPVSQDRV